MTGDQAALAACARSHVDMFPRKNDRAGEAAAKAVCAVCPVADACLTEALHLAHMDDAGVRGGLTLLERDRIRVAA